MPGKFYLSAFFLLILLSAKGQNAYPSGDFRSPVDTTISLAGNFGEIRPNHFHAGFDVKTNGKEGMKLYAVGDGYISRIKISSFGYGKAVYIRHPNGYTSVYAHLSALEPVAAAFIKNAQYLKESFELDTLLEEDQLPVRKGQLIGLSGNTGGSQAPHLHFEIRETATEKPINPYFFGYKIPDAVKPKITLLAIYPLDASSSVNGKNTVKKIKPLYTNGKYSLNKADTLTLNGKIGFGIEAFDTENRSTNQNGVFSIELQSGGKRIYYHEFEKFSFENSRYVNTHIDYEQRNSHKIQKCFLSKNNQAGIYKDLVNNGIIDFKDDSIHWIRFIVKDFAGNTSELMLKIKSSSATKSFFSNKPQSQTLFDCTKENAFKNENVQVSIPAYALYDDIAFTYSSGLKQKGTYSNVHRIHNDKVPLQKAYSLSIKADQLPERLRDKACIISVNPKGRPVYEGGTYKDGMVTTNIKTFGSFAIAVDTIPPKIKTAFKYTPGTTVNLSNAKTISIIADDNHSGIKKYRAKIDGKWVLCEYEYKKDLLFYTFDGSLEKRVHTFEIEVTDDKGNSSTLLFSFKR
jgi:murein DD-endopeptidase MepM/ murein hydrolase activator NlpD